MEWGIWAIITVVLAILEVVTVDFTFIMIAGGALAATGVSALGGGMIWQIITFAIVTILLLFFIRPLVRRHLHDSSTGESNVYAMAGREAITLTAVDRNSGRVKVGGEVWSAKTFGATIPADEKVIIQAVEGAQVVIVPKPAHNQYQTYNQY
ncbi:MAG: NfeD family protein [Actinomycetaceae bacterium]|nr:NfeD family protein [Actinomycetaceae bacterium]